MRPPLRTASGVTRQSATIVADNRLALPASLAVEYGRILPCRALLAARSTSLGLGLVISRHSLIGLGQIVPSIGIASAREGRSVISRQPGLWVMAISGFACSSAYCGVMPQPQNTGTSPARSSTGSPAVG
jgi:hypothetical protein